MEDFDSTTGQIATLPARRSRGAAANHRLEPDAIADRPPPAADEPKPGSVDAVNSIGPFTEAEVRELQNDDAMAAGMIATILSLAFVTLLSLTIAVNVWMQCITR